MPSLSFVPSPGGASVIVDGAIVAFVPLAECHVLAAQLKACASQSAATDHLARHAGFVRDHA